MIKEELLKLMQHERAAEIKAVKEVKERQQHIEGVLEALRQQQREQLEAEGRPQIFERDLDLTSKHQAMAEDAVLKMKLFIKRRREEREAEAKALRRQNCRHVGAEDDISSSSGGDSPYQDQAVPKLDLTRITSNQNEFFTKNIKGVAPDSSYSSSSLDDNHKPHGQANKLQRGKSLHKRHDQVFYQEEVKQSTLRGDNENRFNPPPQDEDSFVQDLEDNQNLMLAEQPPMFHRDASAPQVKRALKRVKLQNINNERAKSNMNQPMAQPQPANSLFGNLFRNKSVVKIRREEKEQLPPNQVVQQSQQQQPSQQPNNNQQQHEEEKNGPLNPRAHPVSNTQSNSSQPNPRQNDSKLRGSMGGTGENILLQAYLWNASHGLNDSVHNQNEDSQQTVSPQSAALLLQRDFVATFEESKQLREERARRQEERVERDYQSRIQRNMRERQMRHFQQ